VQNEHEVRAWATSLEAGKLAVKRGWLPTQDDHLRRKLIMELFCQLEVDTASFARREAIDFERYFQSELAELKELERDGLVAREGARVKVTPQGQLLLRNVAAVFDAYLKRPAGPRHHSKAV
jgi:oxygen-independent coproporphyrinogen-3 oxidase